MNKPLPATLNITLVDNSQLVGKTDGSTVNYFLTIFLVNWWPVHVQQQQFCVQYDQNHKSLVKRTFAGKSINHLFCTVQTFLGGCSVYRDYLAVENKKKSGSISDYFTAYQKALSIIKH